MLMTFLGMFLNWPMLIFALVLLAIAAAIWFTPTLGPTYLLKVVTDFRTWIACAVVIAGIMLWHNAKVIQKQQATINVHAVETHAAKDTAAVVTDVVVKKHKRAVQQQHEQEVINAAPVGGKTDAIMDEIAKENGQPVSVTPAPAPKQ